jgi:hypothetical protein
MIRPLLSIVVYLFTFVQDPGMILFGDELYEGELKFWGIFIRGFCLMNLLPAESLWIALMYVLLNTYLPFPFGDFISVVVLLLVWFGTSSIGKALYNWKDWRPFRKSATATPPGMLKEVS